MIETFVKRPVTTIVFVMFFVVLGVVSYFNLNVEENPKIDFPIINVKVVYPGATPLEVENQVIRKIEDAVSEISAIKHVNSYAYENFALVVIEFLLEADVNIKSIEVKDKIDAIVVDLPGNTEKPIVEKFDPLAKSVMDLVLSSDKHSLIDIYEYADKKLKRKLTAISGVAKVDFFGGLERQINIKLDPVLMKKYFISIDKVIETVKLKNLNIPAGTVDTQKNSMSVRYLGEFLTLTDIANTPIVTAEGTNVKLSEIAIVEDGHREAETLARFNGKEVLSIGIVNVSDANAINIAKAVRKVVKSVESELPVGMKLEIANDSTTFISDDTLDTELNILIGIILTIIILFLFTGSFKVTLISAAVLPTSVVSTIFLVDMFNFSINIMTLLAIAISLGTLIANAIVIIENVLVHINKGKDSQQAAIDGTKEVTLAILASAGTNLVVFTPIAFMAGMVGRFMLQFGFTVIFATLFSLIASFALTPMLCGLILRGETKSNKSKFAIRVDRIMNFFIKEYRVVFNLIFKYPITTIFLSLLLLASSMLLIPYMANEFAPDNDKNEIGVNIVLPMGSKLEDTNRVVSRVEKIVRSVPEVNNILSTLGDNGVENATLFASLADYSERQRDDLTIIQDLIPKLALIPDVEIDVTRGKSKGSIGYEIMINIYGDDYQQMILKAAKMTDIMNETGYFQAVVSSYKLPKDEIRFIPNQSKLTEYGVPNAFIANAIRASIYGDDSNVYKENGEEYAIMIELNDDFMNMEADIQNISVPTRQGLFPLSSFGKLEKKKAMSSLRRRDKESIITLSGNLVKSSSGPVQKELEKAFKQIDFSRGEGFYFAGNNETQAESEFELMKAFIIASILTFMVLAAILNSLVFPVAIGATIFTSLSGVIAMLFFTGYSINIASLLAIVMLVGLVVNNAIILIDRTLVEMSSGVEIIESLWVASKSKFRVIIMTSLAIVVGALPQMQSIVGYKASMGAVIVGGMLASILFTFILTPVLFWYLDRMRRLFIK